MSSSMAMPRHCLATTTQKDGKFSAVHEEQIQHILRCEIKSLKCTHCGIFFLISGGYKQCTVNVTIFVFGTVTVWSIGIIACSNMLTKHNIRFILRSRLLSMAMLRLWLAPAHAEQLQIFSRAWGADSTDFKMWNKKSQMYTPWDILSNIWELQRVHCCCCYFYLRNRYCLIHWN